MQNTIRTNCAWLMAPALLLLAGCSSDADFDFDASQAAADLVASEKFPAEAIYNPSAQQIPIPSNLLFNGSTDGTINIELSEEEDIPSNPRRALSLQTGFSTVAPIVTEISETLDPTTLVVGSTIRIFEVETLTEPVVNPSFVTQSTAELTADQISATQIGNNLVLIPTTPLKPSTSYMVVLTNAIKDLQGDALAASFTYELAKGETELLDANAEGLRTIIRSHATVLDTQLDIRPANVALSWVFSTQSTRDVLEAVKSATSASALEFATSNVTTTADWNPLLPGIADIYEGFLILPYYLAAPGQDTAPQAVVNSYWKNSAGNVPGAIGTAGVPDFMPESTVNVRIPVLMTLPNDNSPSQGERPVDGWPVTIFQHGITRNRTDMLLMADAMAGAGRAVIAIDMPLHGLTDATDELHSDDNPFNTGERTFELDLATVDATTGSQTPGPDNTPEPSGTYFINLTDLANARDNLRQAVADLFVLTDSLQGAQVDGASNVLNPSNLTFVGHSLGGILGTTMLAFENRYQAATLAMPGGGIAQLLANSAQFGPIINAGLAAQGVNTDSADYQSFLTVAQTMLDSADPINHANTLASDENLRIHLIEVLGDLVVPNSVATGIAPLSGTDPLIRLLGLDQADNTVAGASAVLKFTEGDHGSIINPSASLAATTEMQSQMAGFAATQGAALPVTNTDVLQAVPAEE